MVYRCPNPECVNIADVDLFTITSTPIVSFELSVDGRGDVMNTRQTIVDSNVKPTDPMKCEICDFEGCVDDFS